MRPPQAGILANKLLHERRCPHGYDDRSNTHQDCGTPPSSFTLVNKDFGIKYVGHEHADHLLGVLKQHCKLTEDWKGELYCGIKLKWDYEKRHFDISMPAYIQKLLARDIHTAPKKAHHAPYLIPRHTYGLEAQKLTPPDNSPHTQRGRHQANPINRGRHIVLCMSSQRHCPCR